MTINRIIVTAARTFNHPLENFSNLRPEITLEATLSEGEDPEAAAKKLQATAEGLVEDHKRNMLESINALYLLNAHQAEVQGLQTQLDKTQQRITELRALHPELRITDSQ